jgi:hypothetical protein
VKRVELVRRIVVLLVAIAAVAIRSPAAQSPHSGTYRIVICKTEPCSLADTANVVVRGHIVLSDSAVTAAHFPEGRARQLQQSRERMWARDGGANGCYALQRLRLEPRTFAGISEVALSRWSLVAASRSGGPIETREFEFGLYRSPDAGTKLIATVTNGVLRGRARSDGSGSAGMGVQDWPDDIVVGERVSDASLQPCIDAAVRLASGPPRSPFANLHTTLPTTVADASYLLFLSPRLVEPAPATRFDPTMFAIGGVTQLSRADGIVTVGIGVPGLTARQYADTTLARIAAVRTMGVASARIGVIGVGRSTEIAADVAARVTVPVAFIFVGSCPGVPEIRPTHGSPVHVLDIHAGVAPPADRCSARFTPAARVTSLSLEPRAGRMPDARADEWVDLVADWIKRPR